MSQQEPLFGLDDYTTPPNEEEMGLSVPPESGLAPLGAVDEFGLERPDVGQNEKQRLFLTLLQSLSPEVQNREGNAGQYHVSGYPPVDKVWFIISESFKSRAMFPPRGAESKRPVCRGFSYYTVENGIRINHMVGFGNPGGDCESCPFAKKDANGKTPCTYQVNYVGIIEAAEVGGQPVEEIAGEEVTFTLKKTGLSVVRGINRFYDRYAQGRTGILLTAKNERNAQGNYYVPVIASYEPGEEYKNVAIELARRVQADKRAVTAAIVNGTFASNSAGADDSGPVDF